MYIKYNNKFYKINIPLSSSVNNLKEILQKDYNINNIENIYHNNILLNDENSLFHYNINNKSVLNIKESLLKGGKKRELNGFQIALVVIYILAIPIILTFGLIPLVSSILEYILSKMIYLLLNITGNSVNNKPKTILASILIFFVTIFRYIFMYIASFTLFGFAFLGLAFLMGKMMNKDVCKYTDNVVVCTQLMSLSYLLVYFIYNLSDYFVNGIENLLKTVPVIGLILLPFTFILKRISKMRNIAVGGIPIIGPLILIYFMLIDYGSKFLETGLSILVSIGCINPNKINKENLRGGGVNINALLLKFIPELSNYIKENKNKEYLDYLENKYKINLREKDLFIDLLNGGGNNEFKKNFETMNKTVNGCNVRIQIPLTNNAKKISEPGNMDEIIEEKVKKDSPSDLQCCNDDYLKIVSEKLKEQIEQPIIKGFLSQEKNKYFSIAINLIIMSFDKQELKILMDYYNSSGLYNKLFGPGFYGPLAKYFRMLFCNILNVGKEGLIMFDSFGGLDILVQNIKGGIVSGSLNLITYLFLIIFFILLSIF